MPDEDKENDGQGAWLALAEGIVEKPPIEEIAQPGAEPAGRLAADLFKAVQLATFPLQIAGIARHRFRSFVDRSLRPVPGQDRVPPARQILSSRKKLPGPLITA